MRSVGNPSFYPLNLTSLQTPFTLCAMTTQNPPLEIPWCPSKDIVADLWSEREKAWLTYTGSLTTRLRYATAGALEHRLRTQTFGHPSADEACALQINTDEPVWIRDIEWWCDGKLAVVARAVIPKKSLVGKGQQLKDVGRRSLGDVLFSDPNLKRSAFEISKSQSGWARRSLFYFHGQPVLVCETLLPPIFEYDIKRTPRNLQNRIAAYWRLMRFDRPIGILLLLWPTLWGLWVAARGVPNLLILTIFIVGVILMRAAGCIINDFADRKIDSYVTRTKKRPLATGQVSAKEAIILFIILCLMAFGLVLLLNPLTIFLAVIGVVFTAIYPFLKRYTHVPQLMLGVAFSWGIPMAFAAQTARVPWHAWLLFIAAVLWPIAYDTQYAMVDRDDDIKIGVKSTAILFGRYDRFIVALLQAIMLLFLSYVGMLLPLTGWYYLGLIAAAGFMGYQHYLMRNRAPQHCLRAFLNNNWVGLVIFVGLWLGFLKI